VAVDAQAVLAGLPAVRSALGELYRDLHAHPELSFAEVRTSAEVARRLTASAVRGMDGERCQVSVAVDRVYHGEAERR
jgi:hippurate hydrolase